MKLRTSVSHERITYRRLLTKLSSFVRTSLLLKLTRRVMLTIEGELRNLLRVTTFSLRSFHIKEKCDMGRDKSWVLILLHLLRFWSMLALWHTLLPCPLNYSTYMLFFMSPCSKNITTILLTSSCISKSLTVRTLLMQNTLSRSLIEMSRF